MQATTALMAFGSPLPPTTLLQATLLTTTIFLVSSRSNTITENNASNNGWNGVYLFDSSDNNIITDNTVSNNDGTGILLGSSNNNTIMGNTASNNSYGIEFYSSSIEFYSSSSNNSITENNASNNDYGIYLRDSCDNIIANNTANSNRDDGIFLLSVTDTQIINCTVRKNEYGIDIGKSKNIIIENNIAQKNKVNGIDFWNCSYIIARFNNCSNQAAGLQITRTSDSEIFRNNVRYNKDGISVYNSSNNHIYLNNFINNTNNVDSIASYSIWNSTEKITYYYNGSTYTNYLGNYWDDYKEKYPDAEEIDGTGIWDTPYSIDSDNDNYPLKESLENYIKPVSMIRIGYQPSTHHLAHMTAIEKGWWERDLARFGIEKVTDMEFPSGPPEMTAMMAEDIDVAYVGVAPSISAIDKGLDAKIVAAVQINGSALVLLPELAANYTLAKDIKGLKIATFPPGSVQDIILKKWLKDNGLDPVKDVDIIPMGLQEAISAIEARTVDGVFLPSPSPAIIEMEGAGRIVVLSGEMLPNHACCCLLVSGELQRGHPEIVEQIIRTHINATEYNKAHPDEAAEIFAWKTGCDVEMVRESFKRSDMKWIHNPHLEIPSTLEYARVHYEMGYTDKLLTEEDLFDKSFYDKITAIFDTGSGTYPSGTITPNQTIEVSKLYTYPCEGTGGHTEYVRIWNSSGLDVKASWNGYVDHWYNISFSEPFTLIPNKTYNYTIRTGSPVLPTKNGWINCTKFTDANGRVYNDWIPAIRLFG